MKRLTVRIQNPEGPGVHIRRFFFLPEQEIYAIRDTVEDFAGNVLFSVPVVSSHSEVEGARVVSGGRFDIDLETCFFSPTKRLWVEKGRSAPMFPSEGGTCEMDYIRAVADAQSGFTVVLYPYEKGTRGITDELLEPLRACGALTNDHND